MEHQSSKCSYFDFFSKKRHVFESKTGLVFVSKTCLFSLTKSCIPSYFWLWVSYFETQSDNLTSSTFTCNLLRLALIRISSCRTATWRDLHATVWDRTTVPICRHLPARSVRWAAVPMSRELWEKYKVLCVEALLKPTYREQKSSDTWKSGIFGQEEWDYARFVPCRTLRLSYSNSIPSKFPVRFNWILYSTKFCTHFHNLYSLLGPCYSVMLHWS